MSDRPWRRRSDSPAVSVVVPVFRTEEHLERCLSSLIHQTFTDFEVIVVDDASPDGGAAEIIRGTGDERITMIRHTQNLGLMQARHTGVRAARGRYVSFVDSDDDVDERFLEVLHDAATQHSADIAQCAYVELEVDGTSRCINRGGERHDLRAGQIMSATLAGKVINSLWSKLVKTELLLAVYDDLSALSTRVDYGEDLITTFQLVCRADRFVHVPDPVYRYRQHDTSMTGRSDTDALFAKVRSLSWIYDQIRPTLTRLAEPPDLVEAFSTREFLEPIVEHLKHAREQGAVGPMGSPMSTAELGLLGAVIADAYGMLDSRTEAKEQSPAVDLAKPAVSVVVPVFRTEEHLEGCLSSLMRQTFTDFEVIVVDDASPGGSAAEIINSVGDERITMIRHTQNLGLMQARHTGVRAARGRYVSFVDSDDDVDERFLEVLHDAATQHSADIAQCAVLEHEADGTSRCINRGGEQHDVRDDEVPRAMLAGSVSNNLCNKLVRTELLLAVYDDSSALSTRVDYGEDLITTFQLVCRADRFVHVLDPVYRYRQHHTSMTGTSDLDALFAKVRSLSWIYDQIRPTLTQLAAPPDLVDAFFTREFLDPIVVHLKHARKQGVIGPEGSPMSAAELGSLGGIIADAYGMLDTRTEAGGQSTSGPQ